ncbi:hypothetical protein [Nocardia amamiensis]|uniref:hypothetical protein n=1 Tax=Nocardia amamiensis TaxID=404578 RepID=UPI0033CAACEB
MIEPFRVGYVRCSTDEQDVEIQTDQLIALGVPGERIFIDTLGGLLKELVSSTFRDGHRPCANTSSRCPPPSPPTHSATTTSQPPNSPQIRQ